MATILDLYNKQTKLQELIQTHSPKLWCAINVDEWKKNWASRGDNPPTNRVRVLLLQTINDTAGILIYWCGLGYWWFSASTKDRYLEEVKAIGTSLGVFNDNNSPTSSDKIWGERELTTYPERFKYIGLNANNNIEFSWAFAIKFFENFFQSYTSNWNLSWGQLWEVSLLNNQNIKVEDLKDLIQQAGEITGSELRRKQEAEKQAEEAEVIKQGIQAIKDNEELKKQIETLEQEKKAAKDENEVLKGKIAKPLDNDEIKKLLLEIKGTTETNKTSLEELNEGLKNVPESIKRQMTSNFNTSETNLRTLAESLTTQIKDIKIPVVDLTGITTSLSEMGKDIEELPTKQSIEELETHMTNIKSNVNLNTDTKIAEVNKKIADIKIPTVDLTEINKKLADLQTSSDDKPSDEQLNELANTLTTKIEAVDTAVKAIKMPDVEKLKDRLQVIFEKELDKSETEIVDRVNNETTTIIVRDVGKALEAKVQPLQTKLDEIETKLKTSGSTTGSSIVTDYSERFDGLQTLLGKAEQKIKDLEPLFDRFKELKEMVQQLIDAQPQEAQEGN